MRKLLLIPVLVVTLFVGFSTPARATPPTEGSGTFVETITSITATKDADGNTFYSLTAAVTITGILALSCTEVSTEVIHPDGTANFKGSETCTGKVAGQPGTFSDSFVGTSAANGSFVFSLVFSGTGTSAGVHGTSAGQGSLTSTGAVGTYTAQVLSH
jgi:hypothetical protein